MPLPYDKPYEQRGEKTAQCQRVAKKGSKSVYSTIWTVYRLVIMPKSRHFYVRIRKIGARQQERRLDEFRPTILLKKPSGLHPTHDVNLIHGVKWVSVCQ